MKCPNCGTENKKDTLFCEICGAALPKEEKQPENPSVSKQENNNDSNSKLTNNPQNTTVDKMSPVSFISGTNLTPASNQSNKESNTSPLNTILKKGIKIGSKKIPFLFIGGVIVMAAVIAVILIAVLTGGAGGGAEEAAKAEGQEAVTDSGFYFGGTWYYELGESEDGYMLYDIYYFDDNGCVSIAYEYGDIGEGKFEVDGDEIICKFEDYKLFLYTDEYYLYSEQGGVLTRDLSSFDYPEDEFGENYLVGETYYRNGRTDNWCIIFSSETHLEIIDPVKGSTYWEYSLDGHVIVAGTGKLLKIFIIVDENTIQSNEGNAFLRYDPYTDAPVGYTEFYDFTSGLKLYYPDGMTTAKPHMNDKREVISILLDENCFIVACDVTTILSNPDQVKGRSYDQTLYTLMETVLNSYGVRMFGSYEGIVDGSFNNIGANSDHTATNPIYASMSFRFNTADRQIYYYGELTCLSEGTLIVFTSVFCEPDNEEQRVLFNTIINTMQFAPVG